MKNETMTALLAAGRTVATTISRSTGESTGGECGEVSYDAFGFAPAVGSIVRKDVCSPNGTVWLAQQPYLVLSHGVPYRHTAAQCDISDCDCGRHGTYVPYTVIRVAMTDAEIADADAIRADAEAKRVAIGRLTGDVLDGGAA